MQDPNLNPDLSEADLFYCGCGSCCATGWSPTAAMDRAREEGIVDEACFPYTAGNQACLLCGDLENRVTKISSWVGITDPSAMKQALADGGPFEASMLIYSDFLSYSGGVYRHTWGDLIGGHGVTIVGYDDYQGYWIAKNNWGTDWGENGWFKIAYGECVIASYAYVPLIGEPSYHVATSASPSGSGTVVSSPPDCSIGTCEAGSLVELAAIADPGYVFSGWSGDVSGLENPVVVVLDSDKIVTAHFDPTCSECPHQVFLPLVWKP